jgi:hypothetical protein
VRVHAIEIDVDLEGPAEEASIDGTGVEDLSPLLAMIIEDSARCPQTGRRLTLQRANQRVFLVPVPSNGL